MKKAFYILVASVALVTLAGCAQIASEAAQPQTVTLPGTGDSQDLLRELARHYTSQHPDRSVIVPDSIGSQGGVEVVATGTSPIGRVSRLPNAEERTQYGDFKYLEFARVPVAFVVSADAGVSDLSEQQICDIFSGRISGWKEVGGNDLPIAVQDRPDSGSNMQAIRGNFACFANLKVTSSARPNERNSDLVESMKKLSGAIGFMPLSEATLHGFKTVTLNGVGPDMEHYKLGVGLGFVYKKPLPPDIVAFIDYLKTEPARNLIRQTGHTPAWPREVIVQAKSPTK
jgi:phosphate transport system substrate-binding protein